MRGLFSTRSILCMIGLLVAALAVTYLIGAPVTNSRLRGLIGFLVVGIVLLALLASVSDAKTVPMLAALLGLATVVYASHAAHGGPDFRPLLQSVASGIHALATAVASVTN